MPPTTPDKAARLSADRLEAVLAASGLFCAAGTVLPAPTLGVAVLIDAIEGHTKKTCPPQIVCYLLQNGSRAAPAVWAELRGSAGILGDFAAEAPPVSEEEAAEIDLAFERISAFRVLATSASASPDGERSWDAETVSYVLREAARALPGASVRELLWEVPLCLIGWLIVQTRRADGERGLTRPEFDEELWAEYQADKKRG